MTDCDMEIPELNADIGLNLVNFLNGTDTSNFLEVVNNCSQFLSIATATDRMLVEIMKKFRGPERILLPAETYENYLQDCEILDDKLVPFENHNPSIIQPVQLYRTPLFQCYSRILPFNTDLYCADFGLIDYQLYNETISSERDLNVYEKKFFKTSTYFTKENNEFGPISNAFVNNIDDFRYNLATRFFSLRWLETIDFSKFAIVGSFVLNSLCRSPFGDTKKQDINLIYPARSCLDFEMVVLNVITKLQKVHPVHLKHEIMVEKISGSLHYYISLPCGVKLNFYYTPAEKSKNPLSHVLHNFDMDICQVAFIGVTIMSTFAFLQALATKSFLVYSLYAESSNDVCTRIEKYCERGFTLLEPINFDGDFKVLMKQAVIPLYPMERHDYVDDDGELQSVITEYWQRPERNIDTYQVQEAFLAAAYPQTLVKHNYINDKTTIPPL
ncbi:unnamed protein product [Rotaria socialis]|uniref:Uncharacterized protein n=1 Tax=Rotaria socialis TaxID=392032 RepID=A0A821HB99_9BILA|nr:unnamed protein product [Rotaria socialis]